MLKTGDLNLFYEDYKRFEQTQHFTILIMIKKFTTQRDQLQAKSKMPINE